MRVLVAIGRRFGNLVHRRNEQPALPHDGPSVGNRAPVMSLSSVVLPPPIGPTRAMRSPGERVKGTSEKRSSGKDGCRNVVRLAERRDIRILAVHVSCDRLAARLRTGDMAVCQDNIAVGTSSGWTSRILPQPQSRCQEIFRLLAVAMVAEGESPPRQVSSPGKLDCTALGPNDLAPAGAYPMIVTL